MKSKTVKIIGNGWFRLNDSLHVPCEAMDPLWIAVHVNQISDAIKQRKVIEYFRNYSRIRPVGCRDLKTLRFFSSQGVNAYFSGCLTTTLKRSDYSEDNNRKGLVISDLPNLNPKRNKFFPLGRWWLYKRVLPNVIGHDFLERNDEIKEISHAMTIHSTHKERFERARSLLKTYASARLVLTSRIHCALPCLALGTPVVLIAPYDPERYEGLTELMNHVYIDRRRVSEVSICRDENGNIVNPKKHQELAEKLRKTCLDFVTER